MFIGFDLAIYLTAPLHVRRERLRRRAEPNSVDRVSVLSGKFHDDFMAALAMAGRRHRRVLTFDTSMRSTEQIVDEVVRCLDEVSRQKAVQ
jgi:thymidylate kinase